MHLNEAFQRVTDYLQDNDNEQITVIDLVNKMKEITNSEAYSPVHMKRKLTEHFGNDIIITDIQGIPNVVTFRRTATSILQAFYQRQKSDDS